MIMFSDCADEISEDIGRIYQVLFHYSINFRGKSVFFKLIMSVMYLKKQELIGKFSIFFKLNI